MTAATGQPTEEDVVQDKYKNILEEAFIRCFSIDAMIRAAPGLRPGLIREYFFLQLRMTCELIALGCLVCHGDIPETKFKGLSKAWKPDDIFARLDSLHPDFFPIPVKFSSDPENKMLTLTDFDQPYLTKSELISLWQRSGDRLHKGNVRNLIKSTDEQKLRTDDIVPVNQKIINLLQNHRIGRKGGLTHFLAMANIQITLNEYHLNLTVATAKAPQIISPT